MLSLKIKDVLFNQFQWLSSDAFSINFHGPPKDGNCSQTGVNIISDFYFDGIYTVWSDRNWVNGYDPDNILHCINGNCYCDNLYQGEQDYQRTINIDHSQFPPPGEAMTLYATLYQHCDYEGDSTRCGQCKMFLPVTTPP